MTLRYDTKQRKLQLLKTQLELALLAIVANSDHINIGIPSDWYGQLHVKVKTSYRPS